MWLANVLWLGVGNVVRTSSQHEETNNISSYEYLSQPLWSNNRVFLSIDKEDDSTENHVNRSRE